MCQESFHTMMELKNTGRIGVIACQEWRPYKPVLSVQCFLLVTQLALIVRLALVTIINVSSES